MWEGWKYQIINHLKLIIMPYTPITIKELINNGATLRITGQFTPVSLKEFVKLAVAKKVKITIVANLLTPITLKELVALGQEYLTLEL